MDSQQIGQWLQNLLWFGGFVLTMAAVVKLIRGGPDKREVSMADQPVEVNANVKKTAQRFSFQFWDDRHKELVRRVDKHDQEITEINRSRERTLKELTEKFDNVILAIGRLEGRSEKVK